MSKSTRTDLVAELELRPMTTALKQVIARARRGHYHDFETPLPFPKHELVDDLKRAGAGDLVERVIAGEWDEDPEVH